MRASSIRVDFCFGKKYNIIVMSQKVRFKLPPAAIVALSFLIAIIIGTALLCLPVSTADGSVDFTVALFTATSAACVTGLQVVSTATYWSGFGQAIILVLIQIGGIGFITIISVFFMFVQKRTSLSQRKLVMQSAGSVEFGGLKKLVKYIVIGTLAFESIGAFSLSFAFVPDFGWGLGIWQAIFTSVSAFCNAGFTLTENSLVGYVADPLVNIVVCILIIVGGVGFFVWSDVVKHGVHFKHYSLHSKLVLVTTGILVFVGWLLFAAFEWNNPATIGDCDVATKLFASLLMSVSPRTAGFNSVEMGGFTGAGSVLTIVYMFIGGSPGSTAGGIKTTTLAVLFSSVVATSKRYAETHVFKRRFEDDAYPQAGVVVMLYVAAVLVSTIAICAIEEAVAVDGAAVGDASQIVFEVVSAVGTVGLSCGITAQLHLASRIILILLMFMGRVGGFTLILVFSNERKPVSISRVYEHVIIG